MEFQLPEVVVNRLNHLKLQKTTLTWEIQLTDGETRLNLCWKQIKSDKKLPLRPVKTPFKRLSVVANISVPNQLEEPQLILKIPKLEPSENEVENTSLQCVPAKKRKIEVTARQSAEGQSLAEETVPGAASQTVGTHTTAISGAGIQTMVVRGTQDAGTQTVGIIMTQAAGIQANKGITQAMGKIASEATRTPTMDTIATHATRAQTGTAVNKISEISGSRAHTGTAVSEISGSRAHTGTAVSEISGSRAHTGTAVSTALTGGWNFKFKFAYVSNVILGVAHHNVNNDTAVIRMARPLPSDKPVSCNITQKTLQGHETMVWYRRWAKAVNQNKGQELDKETMEKLKQSFFQYLKKRASLTRVTVTKAGIMSENAKIKPKWGMWSISDKDTFFEGLFQYGHDFDAIQNLIAQECRKKGQNASRIKNKDQVRHFYYSTWNDISKYVVMGEDVEKETQQLYGLVNYGVLRKKIKRLNDESGKKLHELILKRYTDVMVCGEKRRITTPACKALENLKVY